ncbi:MAG: hypothetical protein AAFQ82_07830 [Myxococcota bacterium]
MLELESHELALHRALRGELDPAIHAIVARISEALVDVLIYHDTVADFDQDLFHEVVASEFDQNLPSGSRPPPAVRITFRPSMDFETPKTEVTMIYDRW